MGCSTLILSRMIDISVYHSTVAVLSDRYHSKRKPNHSCIPLSNSVSRPDRCWRCSSLVPGRMSNLFVAAWSLAAGFMYIWLLSCHRLPKPGFQESDRRHLLIYKSCGLPSQNEDYSSKCSEGLLTLKCTMNIFEVFSWPAQVIDSAMD